MIDKDELKRELDIAVDRVNRGEILGGGAIVICGHVKMTIKAARKYLGLPPTAVLYAVRGGE